MNTYTDEMIEKYKERFDEVLPLEMLTYETWDDVAKIIEECLEKGKTAEELGYVGKIEEGVYY